jgi:surfactin family lipopeptide synthetase A
MSKTESVGAAAAKLSTTKRRLLQRYLRGDVPRAAAQPPPVTRRPLDAPAPLSPAQEQIWLHAKNASGLPPFYNESIIIHRHGPLDIKILERSFREIIRRHEIWRTSFDIVGGRAVQVVHPVPDSIPFSVLDLQKLPIERRREEAVRVATENARKPFDLENGPLVRARLIVFSAEHYQLVITMHQSVTDGVSVNIVFPKELVTLYDAFLNGHPSPMPDLPVQYADYAYWQRRQIEVGAWANQFDYWQRRFTPQPEIVGWPADHPQSSPTYRGAIRPFIISDQLTQSLIELSRAEEGTLFMTLLAVYAVLLQRRTGKEDVVIGTPAFSGRKTSEVQALIGYFQNPILLRVDLSGNPTVRELLRRARTVVAGALANDDIPLEHLLTKLGYASDPYQQRLLKVAISLNPPTSDLGPGWNQTFMDVESGGSSWELYIELGERSEGLIGRAQYNPDVYEEGTITRMLADWQILLERVASAPESRLSALPVVE